MDKKSWPWKKKLSDNKMSPPPELSDLSPKQAEEQQEVSALSSGHIPLSHASSESSLKAASGEQLPSSAMADVSAKDDLVKQHMKIAEEAVAGWEKAEAEAADLKEKLEAALQQKSATEDRVSHLDGALKECMKQLRHVREEQEQRIHEAIVKKTREWDKMRTDLEARLDDATNELCEALAENQAMSKSLQERAKTIAEISDTKAHLEADSSALQVRLASVEKENARFKYELHVLSKELELRNEERDYVKRAEEAASKQNLEKAKKIAKLEEECQRLKLLVKKRQPSPAPMSHMNREADLFTNERIRRRSPCRRSTTSLPLKATELSGMGFGFDNELREENKILSDQLQAMQDEAKSLRELLAKKDDELQTARLMCVRTASKLSNAEEQQDIHPCSRRSTKSASVALLSRQLNGASMDLSIDSVSGESGVEDVCAESWATALIAELAQFKAESISEKVQAPVSMDLMDDFAEMEKLASLSSPEDACKMNTTIERQEKGSSTKNCVEKLTFFDEAEYSNGRESESPMNELCKELKEKLADAEDQLYALQEKQSSSDATISQLQHLLALKFGLNAEGMALSKAMEAAKLALEDARDTGEEHAGNVGRESKELLAEREGEKESIWPTGYIPHVDAGLQEASDTEMYGVGADLAAAVRKVLDIVESIGQTDYTFPYAEWISTPSLENDGVPEFTSPGKQWRSSGLDACVESLINLCNSLVQGKVDIIDFIAEVASALDWLVGLIFTPPDKSTTRNISQRLEESCGAHVDSSDSEMISAESSPTQLLCNSSDGEEAKATESHDVLPDQSSVSNLSFQFSESSALEDDMSKHVSEEAALKLSLEVETKKASKYESEILRLKVVNDQLEQNHELTMGKLADLEAQVQGANEKIQKLSDELLKSENRSANLEAQLHHVLDQKQSIANVVADLEYAKGTLESELSIARENVEALESKVLGLEEELGDEIRCRKEVEFQLIELREQQEHHQGESNTHEGSQSMCPAEDAATRLKKEQEIAAAAEKLAECQQTIMDLGKQLKALGVSKNMLDTPFTSTSESAALPEKMPRATTPRLRSASDQVYAPMSNTSIDMQCNDDPMATSTSRSERDRKQEQGGITKTSKSTGSANQEEPGTPVARKGVQSNGKHGKHAALDVYSNQRGYSRFPASPTRGDNKDNGQGMLAGSNTTSEQVVNSPLRSPARFLSLRSKNAGAHEPSRHGDNEATEKHGSSGFSRFFGRTKSGH